MRDFVLSAIESKEIRGSGIELNSKMAANLAQKWNSEPFNLPSWDAPILMDANLELTSKYFFFGNAVNFGFHPLEDSLGPAGSEDFWLLLRSHPELLDPAKLLRADSDVLSQVFGNKPDLDIRAKIWRETAQALHTKYNGSVVDLYEANHWNAPEIIQALSRDFNAFRDIHYGIPFMRNARLCLFMTHARFQDSMLFTNLEQLVVGADIQVFNGLNQLGVLALDRSLEAQLELGRCDAGLEFDLRCLTLLAADILLTEINKLHKPVITGYQLDYALRKIGTSGKTPLPLAYSVNY